MFRRVMSSIVTRTPYGVGAGRARDGEEPRGGDQRLGRRASDRGGCSGFGFASLGGGGGGGAS